jgi:glycosyltransferase involved in cell wall biosynthesis
LLNHFIDAERTSVVAEDGDYILYVGRLSEEKGLFTLIDAVMKEETCRLKIVGDGPLMNHLTGYTDAHGGNKRVEFLRQKSREEVIDIMHKCSFLVIPSEWYEVSGQVIFEAFSCGKPVIGSRIGGIPEFIKEGETGLLFEPGNSDELSKKIKYLTDNHDKVREMGKACRTYVLQELNPENHYQKLMEIYRNVSDRSI